MNAQARKRERRLPVVCFDRHDDLSVESYLVKAAAITRGHVELTSEDREKLEYTLRVFRGLRAATAAPTAQARRQQKKPKA